MDPAIFDFAPPSSGSSGYGSGEEPSFSYNTDDNDIYVNKDLGLMHDAIQHDHKYTQQTPANTIFDGGSLRQADLLVNNYFKNEPPPVLYQRQICANDLSCDQFVEDYLITVDDAVGQGNPNVCNFENPNSSSATLIQPTNQIEIPNISNIEYPMVLDDVEMSDFGNFPNELYADENKDNQQLDDGESFNMDDEFFEALRELTDALIPNESDATYEVTQSCKVYELLCSQDLNGTMILIFEPKLRDFLVSDIIAHEPSTCRIICNSETTLLMSSCICEDMKLLNNDHLLVVLKCKELVK